MLQTSGWGAGRAQPLIRPGDEAHNQTTSDCGDETTKKQMTTYLSESTTCGACGRVFIHKSLASTNSFGSPDLDLRPPEMHRSTMASWVQRCPTCGYCAKDVSKFDEKLRCVIEDANYQLQLADKDCPELASTLICAGKVSEFSADEVAAGWNYLRAAWAFDDQKCDPPASQWRSRAADIFAGVVAKGTPIVGGAGGSQAIIVDCLRRSSRGTEALAIISQALEQDYDDVIRQALIFQKQLIERGDVACHRVEEALPHPVT